MKMKRWGLLTLLLCGCLLFVGCKSKVELGQYKDLTYTPVDISVSDGEIQAALDAIVEDSAMYTVNKERNGTAVQNGDILNIDYSGVLASTGEVFVGGTSSNVTLTIGSGRFIPGFEEALIGKTVGKTCEIHVTFPVNYERNEALSGQEAIFTVTIHSVQNRIAPELTDELVEEYTEGVHKTVASYREYVTEYLRVQKESSARNAQMREVLDQVIANANFVRVKQSDIDECYDKMMEYYNALAASYSITLELYVQYYYNQTLEAFSERLRTLSEDTVKEQLVLQAVIDAEGITLSKEQYDAMLPDYMESYQYTSAEAFEADYTKEALEQSMLYDMAIDFLMEHSVPKTQ